MKIIVRKRQIGNIPILEVVEEEKLYEAAPLLIYYHGWQTAKELVLTQGRKLAKQGFRVVLPDAANHGERKTEVSPIPSLTFWNSIQTNLFEFGYLVDFFENRGVVTNGVYVGGVSMGGMTTCALMATHPEIKAAACVMGTPNFLAYRQRISTHAKKAGFFLPNDYIQLTSWIESYDLMTHYSSEDTRPFLFWHGTEDEKIPFEHVEQFVQSHSRTNLTLLVENERHLVKGNTMEEIESFFMKTLKAY